MFYQQLLQTCRRSKVGVIYPFWKMLSIVVRISLFQQILFFLCLRKELNYIICFYSRCSSEVGQVYMLKNAADLTLRTQYQSIIWLKLLCEVSTFQVFTVQKIKLLRSTTSTNSWARSKFCLDKSSFPN